MILKHWFGLLFCLSLFACKSTKFNHVADIDDSYIYINKEDSVQDDNIEAMIAPYRKELSAKMDIVLIENKIKLEKGRPNSNLGNWLADLLLDHVNANERKIDFAVQNQGGIRVPYIGVGDMTVGKVYELMPFENALVVMHTSGAVVQTFCDHMAASGGWPISRTLSFKVENEKASEITINGEPLDERKMYRYAVPDYIANGGSDCEFFKALEHDNLGVMIRDVIIEDLRSRGAKGEVLQIEPSTRIHE